VTLSSRFHRTHRTVFAGHSAIGLAIKAARPSLPTWPIMLGVGFIDMVNGTLIMLGADTVRADLSAGPYLFFDLTFIDWDHSLLMAVLLSLLWALLFVKDRGLAWVAGLAAFSHFIADWPVHNDDMALFPHAQTHVGLGLWGQWGTGAWVLEGVFVAALVAWAWRRSARRGVSLRWPALVIALVFLTLSPWLSPMKFVATLDEPAVHLAHGALVALGFLIPGLLLSWLIDAAERHAALRVWCPTDTCT